MHSFKVNCHFEENVIVQLASAFDVEYNKCCDNYKLSIPLYLGKGTIEGSVYSNGLNLLSFKGFLKSPIQIEFSNQEDLPVKFLYCLNGGVKYGADSSNKRYHLNRFQHAIVAGDRQNSYVLSFAAQEEIQLFSLEVSRNKFSKLLHCEMNTFDNDLVRVFKDLNPQKVFYHQGFYSLKLADLFTEVLNFPENKLFTKIFLEGQLYKILSQQILEYEREISFDFHTNVLQKKEVSLIRKAATIIEEQLSDSLTVNYLVGCTGLNANKIQLGFRVLYGQTVNRFIRKKRLEKAKNLLQNTDYNVTEIAEKIGISSISYFSKIFKEEYQIKPSALVLDRKKQIRK